MKKTNYLIGGAAALVSIIAISGIALSAYAQTPVKQGLMRGWNNLSSEQKAEMEARRTERNSEREQIHAAVSQGYAAWAEAIKKYRGENAPILKQVNADNFAKYAQAMGYVNEAETQMEKARTVLDEIGVDGVGMGMGMGAMKGNRGGGMRGANCQVE